MLHLCVNGFGFREYHVEVKPIFVVMIFQCFNAFKPFTDRIRVFDVKQNYIGINNHVFRCQKSLFPIYCLFKIDLDQKV